MVFHGKKYKLDHIKNNPYDDFVIRANEVMEDNQEELDEGIYNDLKKRPLENGFHRIKTYYQWFDLSEDEKILWKSKIKYVIDE